jgi:hypothetical protein
MDKFLKISEPSTFRNEKKKVKSTETIVKVI